MNGYVARPRYHADSNTRLCGGGCSLLAHPGRQGWRAAEQVHPDIARGRVHLDSRHEQAGKGLLLLVGALGEDLREAPAAFLHLGDTEPGGFRFSPECPLTGQEFLAPRLQAGQLGVRPLQVVQVTLDRLPDVAKCPLYAAMEPPRLASLDHWVLHRRQRQPSQVRHRSHLCIAALGARAYDAGCCPRWPMLSLAGA